MGKDLSFRLILASGSPSRRDLLTRAGWPFEVKAASIDEPTLVEDGDIRRFVQRVSWLKAAAVAPTIDDGIVLAADSVGWLNGKLILKPDDENDARRILRTLGGTTHELWTGVTLWRRPDNVQICWQECSHVAFHKLTDAEIDTYLATRQWEGCSGAYAVQEQDDPYVRVVEGSVSNVIGLPLETLERVLDGLALL